MFKRTVTSEPTTSASRIFRKTFGTGTVWLALALGAVSVAGLSGCTSTDPSVARSRSVGKIIDDQVVRRTVNANLNANQALRESRIDIACFNGAVLLVGQVPSEDLRQQAAQIAASTADVARVYNELSVGPNAGFGARSSDNLITSKVKSQLWAEESIKDSKMTVVTESGVVYLMGLVNRQQANLAAQVAQRIDGVQKVMTLFEIIGE
jgi:osmotically-inducible protein OsmY